MIFETDLFVRDTLRINILKELMAGNISLAVQLDNGAIESYATQIHSDMGRVKVYGNFNMSESVDGEVLTIRPISVDRVMKAVPAMAGGISGKEIALVRSATKQVENTYPFDETFMGLELVPSENKYILRLEYADSPTAFRPNSLLFRRKSLSFRKKYLLFRKKLLSFRKNSLLCRNLLKMKKYRKSKKN